MSDPEIRALIRERAALARSIRDVLKTARECASKATK